MSGFQVWMLNGFWDNALAASATVKVLASQFVSLYTTYRYQSLLYWKGSPLYMLFAASSSEPGCIRGYNRVPLMP